MRAGSEATVSETVHAHGLRHCRYRGLAKTHVQHVLIAAGANRTPSFLLAALAAEEAVIIAEVVATLRLLRRLPAPCRRSASCRRRASQVSFGRGLTVGAPRALSPRGWPRTRGPEVVGSRTPPAVRIPTTGRSGPQDEVHGVAVDVAVHLSPSLLCDRLDLLLAQPVVLPVQRRVLGDGRQDEQHPVRCQRLLPHAGGERHPSSVQAWSVLVG
ncbi:hypothetical protein CK936_11815 [Streptomyces albireticuli]|uniref:Transposase DDE domain-containing protein n=1 Tax=Streptomyces albireticuli TaxID=1940 RepID=A0A2A2DBA9_9ACTN|nr:hypothetical protein CK936_11815 [Streptomyces albireticuli]